MSNIQRYNRIAAPAAPTANPVSQATAIEQSRVVAEVQAAVLVAQQNRRNKAFAIEEMWDATGRRSFAERAFFKFPRGGQSVSGPSIHLARELARCWGNIQFGVTELRRDDANGVSEMQAYAWDLETNARNSTTFIVPHKRDTQQGAKELVDMRDIYENNANNGARRLREAIFAVLPGWFVDEAQARCRAALAEGDKADTRTLAQRIAASIQAFESKIGVTRGQLEAKIGRPSSQWTEHDLGELAVSFRSVQNNEVPRDVEFPTARVTVDEIASNQGAKPEPSQVTGPAAADNNRPENITTEPKPKPKRAARAKSAPAAEPNTPDPAPLDPPPATQRAELGRVMAHAGIRNPEEIAAFLSARVGRNVKNAAELTYDEIGATLAFIQNGEETAEPAEPAPAATEDMLPLDGDDK